MTCASFEQLFAWARCELPVVEAEPIRLHLDAGCQTCRHELEQVEKILAATACPQFRQPPTWLIEETVGLITRDAARSYEFPVERISAFLLFDSFTQPTFAGIRSGGPMSRQLLYRTEDHDINLSINHASQTHAIEIVGRALPLKPNPVALTGAEVELLNGSAVVCTTKTNQVGMFTLQGVQEGVYDLRIALNDEEIDIIGLTATVCPRRGDTVN